MSRAGKKDVLAAGGRKMAIAGGIGDSPLIEKLKKIESGEIKPEEKEVPEVAFERPKAPKLKFIPKNKHLLVRRDEAATLSSILVVDNIEKEQNNTGVVVESNCVDYPVGIRVVFGKYAGTEYRLNGEVLLIMRDEDVQGLLVTADIDTEEEIEVFPGLENTSYTVKTVATA